MADFSHISEDIRKSSCISSSVSIVADGANFALVLSPKALIRIRNFGKHSMLSLTALMPH
jgi:hypothetical protein